MNDLQKENLSFIAGSIESSPTPHALASAVKCIANVLLSGEASQPAAAGDAGSAVIEATAAQLTQSEDPQDLKAGDSVTLDTGASATVSEVRQDGAVVIEPGAPAPDAPMSEEDRKTFATLMRRSADALEAGEETAVHSVGQYLAGIGAALGEEREAIMARIRGAV